MAVTLQDELHETAGQQDTPGDDGTPTAAGAGTTSGTALVRMAIATAMGLVVALIAGDIFDQIRPVLLLAPLAAGLAAAATRPLRRTLRWAIIALVVAAVPIAAATLEGGGLGDGVASFVRGPRRLLTTEWPSPVDPTIVGFVALVLAVTTGAAVVLASGRRWRFAPVIPIAIATVIVVALSAPLPPSWWNLALLGLGTLLLGAVPAEPDGRHRVAALLGDRTVGVTVSAVAVVALAVSALLATTHRADPRRVEDADLAATILDPIEASVALQRADPVIDLYAITDRSPLVGRALPARWRIAALDLYDGQRWVPQVTLRPIGTQLGLPPELGPGDPPPISYEVVFLTDDLDLVPFPGRPLAVDVPVETDLDRVVVRLTERPRPGTTVDAVSMVAPVAATLLSEDESARLATRPIDEIAQIFTDRALELAGEGEAIEQLRTIESTMQTEWTLDPQTPGGGQQLALLERFVDDTRRGTREQFVTAFVLLARSLGVDARVATGFIVPPDELTSPLAVRSSHAAAWPEVRLADGSSALGGDDGWIAFDPVPPREDPVEDEPLQPPEAQSPAAAQPPIIPPADEPDEPDDEVTEVVDEAGRWDAVTTWAVRVGAVTSIGLLPLVLVVGVIVGVKWWRRRRRRRLDDPARRVRAAWADVTDSLVDAGLTVEPAWTDDRIAIGGADLARTAPHELRRLAAMATAVTFGSSQDARRLVDDATVTSRTIDDAMRHERTRWQRIRWRLSLRSLRRRTRSPIVV